MENLLDDLDLAIRDHDWHRVKAAASALRLGGFVQGAVSASWLVPAQENANASAGESNEVAPEEEAA